MQKLFNVMSVASFVMSAGMVAERQFSQQAGTSAMLYDWQRMPHDESPSTT